MRSRFVSPSGTSTICDTLPQKRNGSNGTVFAGALNPRCSPSISPVIAAAPTPRTTETGSARPVYRALTVAAVERFAKADRRQAATLEQFDADDWLLTTENQT